MTKFIYDEAALEQAIKISAALFSGDVASLTAAEIEQGFKDVPTFVSGTEEAKLVDWLVELGIEPLNVNRGRIFQMAPFILTESVPKTWTK